MSLLATNRSNCHFVLPEERRIEGKLYKLVNKHLLTLFFFANIKIQGENPVMNSLAAAGLQLMWQLAPAS